jgi:hypothetical protein
MGRPTILLLTLVGAMLFACTGVVLAQQERTTPDKAQPQASEGSQAEVVRGSFHVQWGDPPRRDPSSEAKTEYVLVDDEGKERKLRLDERDTKAVGGPRAFDGKRVEVRGARVPDEPEGIDVEAIDFERPADAAKARSKVDSGDPAAQALEESTQTTTSMPWVTIGCRFSESAEKDKSLNDRRDYYQRLMGVSYEPEQTSGTIVAKMSSQRPGLDHFWKEVSANNIDLAGSQVGDGTKQARFWYELDNPQSDYMNGTSPDLTKIVNDCTAKADADVNLPDFVGINLVLSDRIGSSAWGGSRELKLDGQTKNYAVAWLPQPFASGHDWFGHEMGHGLGMPHSSGPYSATYDSDWDVMSGSGECDEAKPVGVRTLDGVTITPHTEYKCISVDTISYHVDLESAIKGSWIKDRKYVAALGTKTLDIERLDQPSSNSSGYLMAKIPIKGSNTQFYTVEARRLQGNDTATPPVPPYDGDLNGRIPGEAIVIHKVDTTLGDRDANVVDATRGGSNPNDAGAMWLPGETFTDKTNGITVKVVGENAAETGYTVEIKRTR